MIRWLAIIFIGLQFHPLFSFGVETCFSTDLKEIDSIKALPYEEANAAFFNLEKNTEDSNLKACISYHHGRLCYANKEKELAAIIWEKAFYDLHRRNSQDSLLMHRLIYNTATVQLQNGDYNDAILNYKLAIQYVSDVTNISKCYVIIGTCYQEVGEFTLAIYNSVLAVKNLKKNKNLSNKWLSEAYGLIAVNYNALEQPDSALKYATLQIEAAKNLDKIAQQFIKVKSYIIQGNAFETKGDLDKYIDYSKQSLALTRKLNEPTYTFKNLSNIGYAYSKLNNKSKAIQYLNEAKQIATEINDTNKIADAIHNTGDVYYNSKDFKLATQYYLEALNLIIPSEDIYDYNSIPMVKSIEELDFLNTIFLYAKFISKSMIAEAKSEGSKDIMDAALRYIKFSDALLFKIHQTTLDNASKFHWREQANELYALAIDASYYLLDFDLIFYFIERGKYFVLRDLMEQNIKLSQLNNKIQEKLFDFRNDISEIEVKQSIRELSQYELANLIELKENYHTLKDTTLNKISIAQASAYNNISLVDVKTKFLKSEHDLYVTYLETDQKTIGFFTTKDSSWFISIPHTVEFINCKNTFIQNISTPLTTQKEETDFFLNGHQLYNFLLPFEIKNYENLIINPSGSINYIPFDALCTKPKEKELLIHKTLIRYTLSPSIELKSKPHKIIKTNTLLIAPVYFKNQKINDLPYSNTEVRAIEKIVGGTLLLENQAKKSNFKKEIDTFENIHFATHSLANSEANALPWIAFYDEKMYLPEIYNLPLKDKFIVLSACETFRGNIIQGEGIMNLVWAIHFAGSKSVVATLWNTYDAASKEIMTTFYKALKAGETKESALRSAKVKYIEENGMQPDKWASFIYIGESSTIQFKSQKNWWKWSIAMFAIFLLLLIAWMRWKN